MSWRRQVLSVLAVLLVVVLGACRQEAAVPTLPMDDDAPIRTDKQRYTPEVSDDFVSYTLETTYTNTTGASVYLVPCGFEPPVYWLQPFDGETWQAGGYSPGCLLVPAPMVEVPPGESFSATLDLFAFRSPRGFPHFGTDLIPGVHRLVFLIDTEPDEESLVDQDDLLPLEQRVSNAFFLKAP